MKNKFYLNTGFVLFILLLILWLPWLGETLFYSKGEPREAVVALSMLQSGDWILPVSCGGEIPYKPPFLAWLIAIFATLFNGGVVNEFISRLPSVLAAISLVMMSYNWAKKIRGEQFAMVMSLVLATSFEVFRAATACRVDMVLTACMVGGMYLVYDILQNKNGNNVMRYIGAVLLFSCAVLTKGPIGSLLPCFTLGIFALLCGEKFWGTFFKLLSLSLAAFAIPAIWYYVAWQQGGDTFLDLVYEENILRLTGKMSYESHVNPFWYNFVTLITGMLPWTLLALMSLVIARRYTYHPFKKAGLFAITTVVVVTVFYCIPASKRSVYLLPVYPFLAYAVASLADAIINTRINLAYARIFAYISFLVPVLLIATKIHPIAGYSFEAVGWWAYLLIALPAGMSIVWIRQAHRNNATIGAALIIWALLTCYGGALMPWVLNSKSDKPTAEMLCEKSQGKDIYFVNTRTYALNYYLDNKMKRLESASEAEKLPKGSVLVFANATDTVGLPAHIELQTLTDRLSDTRRKAWWAVVK